ncbi:FAD binding domain-containing protein [Propylenella binzhouense]|uniref:Xanthine dehydrogenase family protein subunit M n=1 Tax=Propylenella binzhouense TaxID=2555902 RepID=A0A964WT43_9HYPH|nr:FAD binding domain-containing protein [Propylenella binzhouense]MYZ47556.1 xanthine dehydrogenase family protein subunit M [Propylenella binzhouense]
MKPPPFRYHDPRTLAETVTLLGTLENAKLLAGGQSLMPMLNMRFVLPDHLIDLNKVAGLAHVEAEGRTVRIGAMTRQRDLERSALLAAKLPIIPAALAHVGHLQTRNRGTIGGSLSHLDPSAELVTVCAALDATVTVAGPGGTRAIPFSEFPLGYMTPATGLDEIVTEIVFEAWPAGHGFGFAEYARRHGDFAIVSAAALLAFRDDGRIGRAALVLGGLEPVPTRLSAIEAALAGETPSEELFAELCRPCAELEAMGDALVPASYRRHLAPVMARRALARAAGIAAAAIH